MTAGKLLRASTFVFGAALLAYLLYAFGSVKVWLDLKAIGWRFVPIVALEVLVSGFNARAWWHTLPRPTRHGTFPRLFLVQLAGNALNDTVPGAPVGGEPVKVLLVNEQFPVSVATASRLSTKLALSLSRMLFVVMGMLAASWSLKFDRLPVRSLTVAFLLTAAGVGAFMLLQVRGLSGPARRAAGRLRFLGGWVERLEHGLGRVDEHLDDLYRARPLDFVASIVLGLIGLSLGVVQIWLMLGWIGLERDWLSSLTIEAFSVLVSFVAFAIPGSLGVQEGGKVLICAALGLPASAGLSMGVAFRVNNTVNLMIGLAVLAWLKPHRAVSRVAVARRS
jgi:uncharacterized protein (TIRG00374 family)